MPLADSPVKATAVAVQPEDNRSQGLVQGLEGPAADGELTGEESEPNQRPYTNEPKA